MSQGNLILSHLQNEGPITSLECVLKYGILRPSNRVQELKALGYDIKTEIIHKKKEDGSRTHYARYWMA